MRRPKRAARGRRSPSSNEPMDESQRDRLIALAREARANAYAPYSVYRVGAALLADDGGTYQGCNVENVVYGLAVCAERNAVGAMVAHGGRRVLAIAVATRDGATPCGACRQVLFEFAKDAEAQVFCVDENGNVFETTIGELLPRGFDSDDVRRR